MPAEAAAISQKSALLLCMVEVFAVTATDFRAMPSGVMSKREIEAMQRLSISTCLAALLCLPVVSVAQWRVDVEVGLYKAERNRVQIPNDSRGDRFDINELGNGSFPGARVTLGWQLAEEHELQFVYAPFVYKEKGTFDEAVRFDGTSFAAGTPLEARYQFSNYRLRYLYHWLDTGRWQIDFGGTLFVRDASVRLRSATVESEDSNVGLVPLFAIRTGYRFGEQWSAVLDADIAIAPQGRAIDLALLGQYRVNDTLTVSGGYRTIEGGADNDDVYSFAWFNGLVLKASYAF